MKHTEGRAPLVGRLVGMPIMLFGIAGALAQSHATHPLGFGSWLVGADVVHDALVAPAVGVGAWLLARFAPRAIRAPLGAALAISFVLLAIAWAPLRGAGGLADNPSLQPLDYATSVPTALAIVWGACALWTVFRALSRSRRHARTTPPGDGSSSRATR
jgi:hypothetical protein